MSLYSYLSAGGSSPTDPLPVEMGLASDSLLDPSPTPSPPPPPPLDSLRDGGRMSCGEEFVDDA